MREKVRRFTLFSAFCMSPTLCFAQKYDPSSMETYRVDSLGRVLEVGTRGAVPCPEQTGQSAVLLIAGQSNAANSGKARFRTTYPTRAVNFFAGKCFPAASPLIGTNGFGGESWTLLADGLIDAGLFDQVILVTSGIGGTEIERWQEGGDLNRMLLDVVKSVGNKYKITHVLWHQGESDLLKGTSTEDYVARFSSLVRSLRHGNVSAPIYVSVASKCGEVGTWADEDAVTTAQRGLIDPSKGIYSGPDTNALVNRDDRYDDCHFSESGQIKFAGEWLRLFQQGASSTH